jgi:hypothetical protein
VCLGYEEAKLRAPAKLLKRYALLSGIKAARSGTRKLLCRHTADIEKRRTALAVHIRAYLEKVTEAAGEKDADASVFEGEGYEDLAETIASSLITFREMLRELSAVEKELNFEDEEFTDREMQYAEHQAPGNKLLWLPAENPYQPSGEQQTQNTPNSQETFHDIPSFLYFAHKPVGGWFHYSTHLFHINK